MKKGLIKSCENKIYITFKDPITGKYYFQSKRQIKILAKHPLIKIFCETKSIIPVIKFIRFNTNWSLKTCHNYAKGLKDLNDDKRIKLIADIDNLQNNYDEVINENNN
jgi:hypothetical protein